jgi:hypothetical protein
MKKKVLFLFLMVLFISIDSCKKDPVCACGVEHPEENLPWLKIKLDNSICTDVYSLFYEGTEYISVGDCISPDYMIQLYDCQGNKTCEFGGANPGGETCFMPFGFTYEFYEENKILIYSQP